MKKINSHIEDFLNYYVNLPDPRYAVMLTGNWGCGKTHFIKQWKNVTEKRIAEDKKPTISKPIYVSLFGLTSIKEVNDAITREIYPIMKSSIYRISKQALNVITKVAVKCDLTDSGGKNKPGNINVDLDIVSLFRSASKTAKENSIIIFDDFERCKVDSVDMLGYINQFVEHSNIRVIILCHETEALADKTSDYDRFKEKLIGRTFEVKPDTECAISEFCNTPGVLKFDERRQRIIKEIFDKVGYNNLRPLYQCLQDFSSVINCLDYNEDDEQQREILDRLLIQFIVAYCEYASNEKVRKAATSNHPFGYVTPSVFLGVTTNDNELEAKYNNLAGYFPTHWVFEKPLAYILKSIHTGEDVTEKINAFFHRKEEEVPLYRRLSQYYLLENDDFEQTYEETLLFIKDPSSSIDTVINILSFLISIDKNGIQPLENNTIESVKGNISTIISNFNNLEEFGEYKKLHIDGVIQDLRLIDDVDQRLKELGNYIEEVSKEKYQELEGNEKKILNTLSNNNFKDVTSLYFQQEGTGIVVTPKYGGVPFFDIIDPLTFVDSLSQLSNENRVRFRNFMIDRTKSIDPSTGSFFSECENLLKISADLRSLANHRKSIEKFSLEKLSQAFELAAEKFKKKE